MLVAVFREVRRVLRADGTCWLNYGDAYARGDNRGGSGSGDKQASNAGSAGVVPRGVPGLKPKDLMMMPARVALALQADGWWLRSEIVWHKPNPMPESCTDRPTSAHEKLYLLTKAPRYFYDAEAVRVPCSPNTHERRKDGEWSAAKGADPADNRPGTFKHTRTVAEQAEHGANLRNVWSIATHSFSSAHFATFPPALVEPCIKAGTSERGACAKCGAPWRRVVATSRVETQQTWNPKNPMSKDSQTTRRQVSDGYVPHSVSSSTTGWEPTCGCGADTRPCVVLDCFGGAGTVGLVADRLQRDAVLIEISAEYAEMARQRIQEDATLLAQVEVVA